MLVLAEDDLLVPAQVRWGFEYAHDVPLHGVVSPYGTIMLPAGVFAVVGSVPDRGIASRLEWTPHPDPKGPVGGTRPCPRVTAGSPIDGCVTPPARAKITQ
ncbi:hypothetical protein GCM10023223_32540 [Stackebrandtia albiflava]